MAGAIAASAEIEAAAADVWAIVRDVGRYPEWSPFLHAVEGEIIVGEPVVLVVRIQMDPARRPIRQTEIVTRDDAAAMEVGWGIQGLFLSTERIQRVVPLGPGRCRYETSDSFEGMLTPIVLGLYGARIQAGFDATARALKARAEKR